MEDIKRQIIAHLSTIIKNAWGLEPTELELVYPVFANQGDLSLPCFGLAQTLAKTPVELAQTMADAWNELEGVATVKAVGPYVNIYLQTEFLAERLYAGGDQSLKNTGQGAKIMIEFANGNTHKEFHIGHLRNVAYGSAVAGLLSAVGYEVISVSYVNDFGIHAAKTIWQLKQQPVDETAGVNRGYLLGQAYTTAVTRLSDDPTAKEALGQIMTEIESRQGPNYELWQRTRDWSLDYFQSIYRQLKLDFKHYYFESELLDRGKALVNELLAKGVLVTSQGAVIADLSADDLGVLVVLRQDGTALYPVADLALAVEKFAETDLAQSITVVDKRQSLYFKQLFALLKQLGYQQTMIHLPYDVVTLPSGMMSSRLGNVVVYHDLYEQCKANLVAETKARHSDWSEQQIDEVAEKLTIATLKFEMIKIGADKVITFNINEALRFDGYTAAYLQYSCARANSLLNKAGAQRQPTTLVYSENSEHDLVVALAKYPEIVAQAAAACEPSVLTQYLFEVAQLFNDFYQLCPVLNVEAPIKNSRLALVEHSKRVLTAGLAVLGIENIVQM